MANIDISKLNEIRDDLDFLEEGEVLFVDENDQTKYVIMPVGIYDQLEELFMMMREPGTLPVIRFNEDIELSYDEYERIKDQIMEAVEKTLMPKPEKLN